MPTGVYASADTFMLSAFAVAWSNHKRACQALLGQSLVINGSKGAARNPLLLVANSQAKLMTSLGARLGLDPQSRMSLQCLSQSSRFKV
jgi:P27 family predicted phage terminase small subunit